MLSILTILRIRKIFCSNFNDRFETFKNVLKLSLNLKKYFP